MGIVLCEKKKYLKANFLIVIKMLRITLVQLLFYHRVIGKV